MTRLPQTLEARLRAAAEGAGAERPAVLDATGVRATHGDLRRIRDGGRQRLREAGAGRTDHIATLMPTGWRLALVVLAASSASPVVQLDPGLTDRELSALLDLLGPRVLLTDDATAPRARALADQDTRVLVWSPDRLDGAPDGEVAEPDDPALLLFTSGTTAAPKTVPLTQRTLAAAADSIGHTLRLGADDRALNVMTLHHGHGIFPGLLAPLTAGGSAICCPLGDGDEVLAIAADLRPSWYSAAPVVHHSILAMVRADPAIGTALRLRAIRSTSSALPVSLLAQLEETLSAPVIEAFALSEAPGQIASNPLDGPRKAGSVGIAQGTRIVLLTPSGRFTDEPGVTGEVLVRGPNVMAGYLGVPAERQPFLDGWLRTGDQAALDDDGYLVLGGRVVDVISRGAEKFAPTEVEAVLAEHPAVREAVVFGRSHPTLGEEAAAAVVLREGACATDGELIEFAAERLAAYKIPVAVAVLPSLPRGRTGKILRRRLREQLERSPGSRRIAPPGA